MTSLVRIRTYVCMRTCTRSVDCCMHMRCVRVRMPGRNIGLDKDLYLFNVYNPSSSTSYADIRAAPDSGAADVFLYLLKETVRYRKESYIARDIYLHSTCNTTDTIRRRIPSPATGLNRLVSSKTKRLLHNAAVRIRTYIVRRKVMHEPSGNSA